MLLAVSDTRTCMQIERKHLHLTSSHVLYRRRFSDSLIRTIVLWSSQLYDSITWFGTTSSCSATPRKAISAPRACSFASSVIPSSTTASRAAMAASSQSRASLPGPNNASCSSASV